MTGPAAAMGHALLLISAAIQIGVVMGAFGEGKAARNAAILAAVISLGTSYTSYATAAATTASTIAFCAQIVSTAVSIADTISTYNFKEEMEDKEDELDKVTENAEMYASELRLMYGQNGGTVRQRRGYYTDMVTKGCEADPYDKLKEVFKDVHRGSGGKYT